MGSIFELFYGIGCPGFFKNLWPPYLKLSSSASFENFRIFYFPLFLRCGARFDSTPRGYFLKRKSLAMTSLRRFSLAFFQGARELRIFLKFFASFIFHTPCYFPLFGGCGVTIHFPAFAFTAVNFALASKIIPSEISVEIYGVKKL